MSSVPFNYIKLHRISLYDNKLPFKSMRALFASKPTFTVTLSCSIYSFFYLKMIYKKMKDWMLNRIILIIRPMFQANWYRASQYCRYHGMHLASIASQEENDRLEKHIKDFGLGHEHFWTSGTDQAEEGTFFWMANGRPITFENWNVGEPNNFRYVFKKIAISFARNENRWKEIKDRSKIDCRESTNRRCVWLQIRERWGRTLPRAVE